jgi:mRNA interferase MazF
MEELPIQPSQPTPLSPLEEWSAVKTELAAKSSGILFKEGEVWWASIGINLGEEIYGKGEKFRRPVLIFKKLTHNSFLGLPITGQEKVGSWYVPIQLPGRPRSAMLHQARVFDRKRVSAYIGTIKQDDFENIKNQFRDFYCPQKVVTPSPSEEAGIIG